MSVMLKEEWENIEPSKVAETIEKWKTVPVEVVLKRCYVYQKFKQDEGWLTIFALTAHSDDVLSIRKDLGLERKPQKYCMHVSLLEK